MKSSKIGRNDPCPCGSGKKYKHCCMGQGDSVASSNKATEVNEELKQALAGKDFSSLEELQDYIDQMAQQRNQAAVDEFHGLSSGQMFRMLYFPFDTPQLVSFLEPQGILLNAPILTLFVAMAEGIGESGVKVTAKGNLPRQLCRDIASQHIEKPGISNNYGRINKEEDYFDLHITRLVAEVAGLILLERGRFYLDPGIKQKLKEKNHAAIYRILLQDFTRKYNWAYADGFADLKIIQQSFLFSLYLLSLYGDAPRPDTFYVDCFIKAYPAVLNEVEENSYNTAEDEVRRGYVLRMMQRFAQFFGLVNIELVKSEKPYERVCLISKLPLLEAVVQFNIQARTSH